MLNEILNKSLETGDLTREEILRLLAITDPDEKSRLIETANAVREKYCGPEVYLRGLIEFSDHCRRNCNYCGVRAGNKCAHRYRIPPDEIVETAKGIAKNTPLKTVVLQSGEDLWYTKDILADIIRRIKSETDLAVTLGVGEREYDEYKAWREAGADRFLLRHEAANRELYKSLHPDSDYDNRMNCLRQLRELGYQVGAGAMVGAPGQTLEHIADDVEFYKTFKPDMIGIGPFISHPDTPYRDAVSGTAELTLNVVAVTRIVTRTALLPATTAIGSIDPMGREKALMAGADVMMPNYTPYEYRAMYEIYPDKKCFTEAIDHNLSDAIERIESVGRVFKGGYGHARRIADGDS